MHQLFSAIYSGCLLNVLDRSWTCQAFQHPLRHRSWIRWLLWIITMGKIKDFLAKMKPMQVALAATFLIVSIAINKSCQRKHQNPATRSPTIPARALRKRLITFCPNKFGRIKKVAWKRLLPHMLALSSPHTINWSSVWLCLKCMSPSLIPGVFSFWIVLAICLFSTI